MAVSHESKNTIKFLCSYGGKILPRSIDGKLRYVGGHTRLLSVDRSISFAELLVKLSEMCGSSVSLRCQLPTDDLDALVSITSDEDLANLIEEYDRTSSASSNSRQIKIRAILSPPKSLKIVSPTQSTTSSLDFSASANSHPVSDYSTVPRKMTPSNRCCIEFTTVPIGIPLGIRKDSENIHRVPFLLQRNPRHMYFVPQWNCLH